MDLAHPPAGGNGHFTEGEWNEFRKQDLVAGKMVGGLMATIFIIGIVIYTIVLWSCAS